MERVSHSSFIIYSNEAGTVAASEVGGVVGSLHSHLSPLLATGDISQGGTSVT